MTENQIIVAATVTQDENDCHQLEPMLQEVKETLAEAGIDKAPNASAADARYWREELDVQAIEKQGPKLFIATKNR